MVHQALAVARVGLQFSIATEAGRFDGEGECQALIGSGPS
jgi:hypothetical protein